MSDSPNPPAERVVAHVERGELDEARARLDGLRAAPVADRTATVRALRAAADDDPATVAPVASALAPFLADEERAVRLTVARLFVAVAGASPDAVVPVVPSLADRLADQDEFYYVRARSAEALGYVALDRPEAVDDPEILADLRVGLSFDEPEVREKLAKALACVALGDPGRLEHQVSSLAERIADGNELVRYHLTTALVAIGCAHPERLAPARDALAGRLEDGDEDDRVRGRAAEALGLLARAASDEDASLGERVAAVGESDEPFLAERLRFARDAADGDASGNAPDAVGTLDGVRETTVEAVEAITSPDDDRACPGCGLALPAGGPPMCPRCGAPVPSGDGV